MADTPFPGFSGDTLAFRILFELLPRLAPIELAGEPKWRANFVSGLKALPVRYRLAA